ncbi:MAG: DUF488 family protein [Nitrososphaerota archaeon]|jgi:uncharacterized protein YeaO (DUF488 family)|nr:DUF488 family protein [Nitrososphaerota archaeon]MDG7036825.1 DUF488 family protein [Nitrososphaerota archaeon]MDG7039278.1 DUF488 family protein [Nitrososphaerota archaeon]
MLKIKRVYEKATPDDGRRYLVDRLWPRGIKKGDLHIEGWLKEIAPSNELRKWFSHDPAKWDEFQARYRKELELDQNPMLRKIKEESKVGNVTLLYASSDVEYNNAKALMLLLDKL